MDFLNRRLGAVEDIGGARRWDGERLRCEIAQRAAVLRRRGIARGSRLLLLHSDGPAFFADLLAGWRLGACVAVANPALTAAQRATLIGFVEPAAVLVANGDEAATAATALCLTRESATAEPLEGAEGEIAADDPALILFTSGTTGDPKGVVLGFGALAARLDLNLAHIGRDDLARSLCPLPTHFGHGLIGNCLTPLLAGCELLLWPSPGVAAIGGLGRLLTERRVTFMSSVPAFWHLALRTPPPAGGSLRRVHVGSAPLPAGLWQRILDWSKAGSVVNMYGITETANWIAGAAASEGIADGRVGRPWGGTAGVLRADGTVAPTGEGELLIRSPCLLQGYFRRPDLDAAVLRDGWFHTGDSGRIDEGGALWLTGRRRDEINRAGLKIQPAEIDLFLQRHPDIEEACCFGWPDPVAGEILAAAVRPAEGAALDVGALRAWCRGGLNRELVPEKWFILPEIPRTDRGKVSRRQVYEFCRTRQP